MLYKIRKKFMKILFKNLPKKVKHFSISPKKREKRELKKINFYIYNNGTF